MNTQTTHGKAWRVVNRVLRRMVLGLCLGLGLVSVAIAGDADGAPVKRSMAVPAARQADRIAVITLEGAIDSTTEVSIKRRIAAAELAGMDAMVIEINSPGGELGAVLAIANTIKNSSITNSVAWIHPDAYSGGAIVGLACQEMVHSTPSSFGDAFVIQYDIFGLSGVQALSPTERTKFLPPLMAEVTDSARRAGYDEYLVQAIVVDGIELWMVENPETGERLSVNEEEYRLLFGDDIVRGMPILAAVTGGIQTKFTPEELKEAQRQEQLQEELQKEQADENQEQDEVDAGADQSGTGIQEDEEEHQEVKADPNAYQPASPNLWDVEMMLAKKPEKETEKVLGLAYPSNRKVFSADDRGRYELVGYITDGSSAIVMRSEQLAYFGFSSGSIENDEELLSFFGATELVRVRMNGFEKSIRVMTSLTVRYFLIAIFLIALFAEMMTAGTGLAGAVSIAALALLIGPGAVIGLNGWWELIAIVIGLVCLAIELFVTPGVGIFGVVGFVMVFAGLLGTFVSAGSGLSDPQTQRDLMRGSVTVILAFMTAGVGWWLILKNAHNLPVFEKFILSGASGVGGMPQKSMLHAIIADDGSVKVGSVGVTTTPLIPIGQAEFGDQLCDVHAAFGTIDRGQRVRVVSATSMRVEVEPIDDGHGEHAEETA